MKILGISAFYHDSAAALVDEGYIVAATQEERFSRIKADKSFPHHSINFCLDKAHLSIEEVDHVVFYEDHRLKFDRILSTYHALGLSCLPSFLKSIPSWLTDKIWMEQKIKKELMGAKNVIFLPHHISHASSAFYPSPFDEATIITIDGVGEWSTATIGIGETNKIKILKELRFPNSLGLFYSAFTYYTGFKVNSGEYKLMGLAPYGTPRYVNIIKKELVDISHDGSISLNQKYFSYASSLKMINRRFCKLFKHSPRSPESEITPFVMDISASVQVVLNEIVSNLSKFAQKITGMKRAVYAGGVALNSVSNGLIIKDKIFDDIWIQPASGDAGGALGAALWFWYNHADQPRVLKSTTDSMQGAYLGLDILGNDRGDDMELHNHGAVWETYEDGELAKIIAAKINNNKIVAVARGRAEFGPRALGNRSILGNAQNPKMQKFMNLKIKCRESFRPFAPMVLAEDQNDYFDMCNDSPYMLFVFPVAQHIRVNDNGNNHSSSFDILGQTRSSIPAVTHVDYSARVQTINRERNAFMHNVISEYKKLSGCSVIINTSFNIRGEPIVNNVNDAFKCFMGTGIDCLVVGNRFLEKHKHSSLENNCYVNSYELD